MPNLGECVSCLNYKSEIKNQTNSVCNECFDKRMNERWDECMQVWDKKIKPQALLKEINQQ